MNTDPFHVQWPETGSHTAWHRIVGAFRPALTALLLLPILLGAARVLARVMDQTALELTAATDLGHAVISGVHVSVIGILVVLLLCCAYGAAGWAAGGLLQAAVRLWPASPQTRLGWFVELVALASAWGALFYALHRAVLAPALPACAEPLVADALLVWFGVPGLLYVWAAALHQGHRI